MTVEGIQLGETFQRNPLLASFCAKTMVYRGLGSGLIRARKDGAKIEFRNDEVTNQFITTIWRPQLAEKGVSNDEMGLSLDEKSASLGKKGVSLDEKSASLTENGLSLDKKSASLTDKGVSLNEKSASLSGKLVGKKDSTIKDLLDFCSVPRTMSEITGHLRIKDRNYIKDNYINPILGTKIAMTKPDVPTSPKQKYFTIQGTNED